MNRSETPGLFTEGSTPPVFWVLYAFAGFALTCMGLAAFSLLGVLAESESLFDKSLVVCIGLFFSFYLLTGLKLLGLRKFVDLSKDPLECGYRLFGRTLFSKRIGRSSVSDVSLVNHRPTANLAVKEHTDAQYYIRGHWRLNIERKGEAPVVLDRHTEKGALVPLYRATREWGKLAVTDEES